MIIDEKGKLFGKVSIIDIAVILVIVIAVLGGVVVYNHIERGTIAPSDSALLNHGSALSNAVVEFEVENVRSFTKDALSVGDKVYSDETDKYIGEIIKIDPKPYADPLTGTDGKTVYAEVPDKYTLTVSVSVMGQQTEKGFFSSENVHFAVGDAMPIKTETVVTTPKIRKISLETDENTAAAE